MSGLDPLTAMAAALAAPAAQTGPFGRLLARGPAPALLRALLVEVGHTVLARQLRFRFRPSGEILCEAYAGRLLSARPGAVQPPFARLDDPGRADLLAALAEALGTAREIWVESVPLEAGRDPTDAGIPATLLLDLLPEADAPAAEPAPDTPLAALMVLSEHSLAWLRLEGSIETDRGGGRKIIRHLRQIAVSRLEVLRTSRPDITQHCILLGAAGEEVLLLAMEGDSTLMMQLPAELTAEAVGLWEMAAA